MPLRHFAPRKLQSSLRRQHVSLFHTPPIAAALGEQERGQRDGAALSIFNIILLRSPRATLKLGIQKNLLQSFPSGSITVVETILHAAFHQRPSSPSSSERAHPILATAIAIRRRSKTRCHKKMSVTSQTVVFEDPCKKSNRSPKKNGGRRRTNNGRQPAIGWYHYICAGLDQHVLPACGTEKSSLNQS